MRNMSVAMTTEQVLAELKDITRRLGWWHLKSGDLLCLVNRTMGFKPGEHPIKYKTVRVKSTRPESLDAISQEDVVREGFPHMTPAEFVEFFIKSHKKCRPDTIVNRIEFEYVCLCRGVPHTGPCAALPVEVVEEQLELELV